MGRIETLLSKVLLASLSLLVLGAGARGSTGSAFLIAPAVATGNEPDAIAVADFNLDGKLDMVTADYSDSAVGVLLGNGDGTFQPVQNVLVDFDPVAVAVGDFNGDGKPDLVVITNNVFILLGNGDGTFQIGGSLTAGNGPTSVAVADFNGDGKLDLAVTNNGGGTVSVLLGNGDGTFQKAVHYSTGSGPISLAAGDFNNDGKLDLVVANNDSQGFGTVDLAILLGNGDGTFGKKIPSGSLNNISPGSLAVADFDGDGNLDVAVGNLRSSGSAGGSPILLAFGDGTGGFSSLRYLNTGSLPGSLVTADIDGDSEPDLIVGNADDNDVTALLGDGAGKFRNAGNYAVGSGSARPAVAVAVGDFNGDGKPDVVAANPGDNNVSVLLAQGGGRFADARDFRVTSMSTYVVAADFNQDGKQDIAVTGSSGFGSGGLNIEFGNGDGTFGAPMPVSTGSHVPFTLAVGDFNGDGFPDLVTLSSDVLILLNNGDGTFQAPRSVFAGFAPQRVVVADFNGDGKQDLAVSINNFVSILLGNGDGTFRQPVPYSAGSFPLGLAAGDFNGDGNLDLAVANSTGGNVSILLGNGDGTFGAPTNFNAGGNPVSVAIGDFNFDGKLDLVAANPGSPTSTVSVLYGNGNGTFGFPASHTVGGNARDVVVGDFSKGLPDIAVTAAGSIATVLFHAPHGNLSQPITFGTAAGGSTLAVGDFTSAHTPDLVVAANDGVTVLLNQTGSISR